MTESRMFVNSVPLANTSLDTALQPGAVCPLQEASFCSDSSRFLNLVGELKSTIQKIESKFTEKINKSSQRDGAAPPGLHHVTWTDSN